MEGRISLETTWCRCLRSLLVSQRTRYANNCGSVLVLISFLKCGFSVRHCLESMWGTYAMDKVWTKYWHKHYFKMRGIFTCVIELFCKKVKSAHTYVVLVSDIHIQLYIRKMKRWTAFWPLGYRGLMLGRCFFRTPDKYDLSCKC